MYAHVPWRDPRVFKVNGDEFVSVLLKDGGIDLPDGLDKTFVE